MRILLVEDEPSAARMLAKGLREQAYAVDIAGDAARALYEMSITDYDAVVLDVMLPSQDGLSVCRQIRRAGSVVPVLMLTARDGIESRIEGLDSGADDYLTKPFGLRELMSRIKALLRRSYGDLSDAVGGRVIRHGDLLIDLERRRVQRGDRRVSLTPTEFEILRHLASRPGRVYTRSELLELLRDYEALDQDEKTINVHVSHLRDKIEDDPATPAFVLTVRGVGYAFAER
jgi:DNA-binding response OmpR family regulator